MVKIPKKIRTTRIKAVKKPTINLDSFKVNAPVSDNVRLEKVYQEQVKTMTQKRRARLENNRRHRAEYLSTLPKSRIKRVLHRLRPRNVVKFVFSKRGFKFGLKAAGLGFAVTLLLMVLIFTYYRRSLPSDINAEIAKVKQTTKFYDRTGNTLLYEAYGKQNRTIVPISSVSTNIQNATVALEDSSFRSHHGIDFKGTTRSILNNLKGQDTQGGSTITQQFIKNLLFTGAKGNAEKSYTRKIKELILSFELENRYSKDQILSFYLNQIPYGPSEYGIEAASQYYFKKPSKDLTLDESAMLASIPQQPPAFNPYKAANKERLLNKQHRVLDLMAQQNFITTAQADEAKKVDTFAKLDPLDGKNRFSAQGKKVAHFIEEAESQLSSDLGESTVNEGGLKVITSIDLRMQDLALESMAKSMPNIERFQADNANIIAIDVPTGQVMAYVGSKDYDFPGYGSVDTLQALLQPGSSIKPFAYGKLFEDREGTDYSAGSRILDGPINISGYKPLNYGSKFYGSVTFRRALAYSMNIPAVKAADIVGNENFIEYARAAGDTEFCTTEECGLSAALGGARTLPASHANAFATIARGGVYKPTTYIMKVQNASGKILREYKSSEGKRVMDQQVAYILSDILSDEATRSGYFGSCAIGFCIPGVKTATKSGTTDDGTAQGNPKDSWLMSYTPKLAVGTWVGNHDGTFIRSPLHNYGGALLSNFVKPAHEQILAKDGVWKAGDWFTKPAGIKTLTIGGLTDIYPSWYQPPKLGKAYTFDKQSKKLASECTPEASKIVLNTTVISEKNSSFEEAPQGYTIKETDNIHKCSDAKPNINLSTTFAGNVLKISSSYSAGSAPLQSVRLLINDAEVATGALSSSSLSYDYTFPAETASVTVKAVAVDTSLYETVATKVVEAPTVAAVNLNALASFTSGSITVTYGNIPAAASYKITILNTANNQASAQISSSPATLNGAAVRSSVGCAASPAPCSVSISVSAYSGAAGAGTVLTTDAASGSPLSL
jgi:membrane peptidoglycan carboxypeptidase